MEYRDYYTILGVEKNATSLDIKRAYRKLAREFHPDVNPGNRAAEERFKVINEAYDVLGDPQKRARYDQLGAGWQQWQTGGGSSFEDFARQWAGGFGGNVQYVDLNELFGRGNLGDLLGALFGSRRGGRHSNVEEILRTATRQRPMRGQDVDAGVEVTLQEAFEGTTRVLEREGRRMRVKIPAGVHTGSRVRLAGQGSPDPSGGPPGDLYLNVTVLPDKSFRREGDDLYCSIDTDLYTAVLGGQVQVPTLEGEVTLKIPAGTHGGKVFRLPGRGMQSPKDSRQRGDMLVTLNVQVPQQLSRRERELFEELARLHNHH